MEGPGGAPAARRARLVVGAVATTAVLALATGLVLMREGPASVVPPTAAEPSASAAPATPPVDTALEPLGDVVCSHPTAGTGGFVPTGISARGSAGAVVDDVRVLALPRDERGVPGVTPLSDRTSFAWDRGGVQAGSAQGHVLINTHTRSDGDGLGNRLLAGLDLGGTVTLTGADGRAACYRVVSRVEVPFADGYPGWTATDGPPEVVIVVCSGRPITPGHWSHRTLWFAKAIS